jgi:putative transposase
VIQQREQSGSTKRVAGRTTNETLPPHTRRILFEQHLPKKDRLPNDVRCNAVIKFCQAVTSTRAAMEEKTIAWDRAAQAHERWSMAREVKQMPTDAIQPPRPKKRKWIADDTPKTYASKHGPKGERPSMAARQVKPPDRNRTRHSFSIDAKTTSKANPYSARWDNDDGVVVFMKQRLALWGCPSKRHRELERLTDRMPDGERAVRKQTTLRYRDGRYHLLIQCLSDKAPLRRDPQRARFVGLDPGVRTFNSFYDHEGRFGTIGENQADRIIHVAERADRLKSHIDTELKSRDHRDETKKRKRRRAAARKRVRQINAKCRDLRADAHWKAARVLCERYDDILLPKFNSRAAMKCLGRTTTRRMLCWSHFEFRQRLQHKAEQLGVKVHLVSEHLSTITCGRCLHIELMMRKNATKWFECRRCGYAIDRDSNGARNVAIMNAERCIGRLEPHAIDA